MLTELEDIVDKWNAFGLALGLKMCKIRAIEANHSDDVEKCLEEVIKAWLESETNPSWETLCTALRDENVDCGAIAKHIEEKFIVTEI